MTEGIFTLSYFLIISVGLLVAVHFGWIVL